MYNIDIINSSLFYVIFYKEKTCNIFQPHCPAKVKWYLFDCKLILYNLLYTNLYSCKNKRKNWFLKLIALANNEYL